VTDEAGRLRHRRGVTEAPGFYFLGLPWQHTRGSALLGWVADDAEHIAERIDELARDAAGDGHLTPAAGRAAG
jgi:putative flavoprotein involved in K+ transport